ncbi:hypothetical protein BC834DRAFT_1043734 [Gloeopeniophorella convolvens]|nr:hypothetical protein BC834DRAFT_1043734 [Gloeopeniophorella convolvens]
MKVLAILYNGFEAAKAEPRLLGTVENELGLRQYLESLGHEFIVTSSKEGPGSDFQQHIVDTDILITTPFHPGYLTHDLMNKAKNLKLCVTAGVGSDHIDLNAAVDRKIQVLEVSGSNVVSVAEQVMMSILLLVRNFVPAHEMAARGDWQVSDIARNAFDLEGKVVGTLGAGRIGYRVLQRLVPFDCKELLYYDYNGLPAEAEKAVGARRVMDIEEFVSQCDVITINAPLHEGTLGLVNKDLLAKFKHGAWLVNTARGAICVAEDVAAAVRSGQLRGYAGDVWNVQPAPRDHPWRSMQGPVGGGNGMTPHYSGTTLDAQTRYAGGTRQILENFFEGKAQDPGNVIVGTGNIANRSRYFNPNVADALDSAFLERRAGLGFSIFLRIRGNLQSAAYQSMTIESLPDVVLLEIFDHVRVLVQKLRAQRELRSEPHQLQWYTLVPAHVCQRWRQIIIASPGRLRLSVLCSWGLPIADILHHSPPEIPLSIYYPSGRYSFTGAPQEMTGILLALQRIDRVRHISIDAARLEMDRLLSTVVRLSPRLVTLSITSHEGQISLPPSFTIEGNECLRKLEFKNICYPLPSAPTLTEFRFSFWGYDHIPGPTGNILQNLACHLRTMPRLERLTLELSLIPLDVLPIENKSRISLPGLSELTFDGWHSHLEDLISIIDAPSLLNLDICFEDDGETPFALPELASYIRASPTFNASAAQVGVVDGSFCIKTSSDAGRIQLRTPLGEQVWYQDEPLDWTIEELEQEPMKSTLMTIHSALTPVLSSVKTLALAFDDDDYFWGMIGDIASMNYAAIYLFYFRIVLRWFRSATALRLDNFIAQAAQEVGLWGWFEDVPGLKDITLSFQANDGVSSPSLILNEWSKKLLRHRRKLQPLDMALHCRIYPPMGLKPRWAERYEDIMVNYGERGEEGQTYPPPTEDLEPGLGLIPTPPERPFSLGGCPSRGAEVAVLVVEIAAAARGSICRRERGVPALPEGGTSVPACDAHLTAGITPSAAESFGSSASPLVDDIDCAVPLAPPPLPPPMFGAAFCCLVLLVVLNPRAALLSNDEVLHVLRELESGHIVCTRTLLRQPPQKNLKPQFTVSENLRTVGFKVIQYPSADYQPTRMRTPEGIQRLTHRLASFGITKAEKLQIVDLTPVGPVEHHVMSLWRNSRIRVGGWMKCLTLCDRRSLRQQQRPSGHPRAHLSRSSPRRPWRITERMGWEQDVNEVGFVDAGKGAGVGGDLDVDVD